LASGAEVAGGGGNSLSETRSFAGLRTWLPPDEQDVPYRLVQFEDDGSRRSELFRAPSREIALARARYACDARVFEVWQEGELLERVRRSNG
jgi:hypothetical protein